MRQPASRLPLTPPRPLPNLQDAGCGGNPTDPQERRSSHPLPPAQIMQLLMKGNRQRTQEPTAANRTSSRSHAVLQVAVRQRSRVKNILQEVRQGRLFMIDLAGSERASQVRSAPPALGRRVSGGWGERRDADLPASAGDHGGGHPQQGGDEGAPLGQGLRSVPEEHDGKRGWGVPALCGKGRGVRSVSPEGRRAALEEGQGGESDWAQMRSWDGGHRCPLTRGGPCLPHRGERKAHRHLSEHLSPTLSPAPLALWPRPQCVGPGPPPSGKLGGFTVPQGMRPGDVTANKSRGQASGQRELTGFHVRACETGIQWGGGCSRSTPLSPGRA